MRGEPSLATPFGPADRGAPRLPGRTAELAVLAGALRDAETGQLRFVLVEGEPGIGKTRLLTEFAAAPGLAITQLTCSGRGFSGGLPLLPLLDALATYVRCADRDRVEEMLGGAAQPIRSLLGDLRGDQPALARARPPGRR